MVLWNSIVLIEENGELICFSFFAIRKAEKKEQGTENNHKTNCEFKLPIDIIY